MMTPMDWSVLQLLEDGREYTVGEVVAASYDEGARIARITSALHHLYDYGYVTRRGRGLHIYRISLEGRDRLWAHRNRVTL